MMTALDRWLIGGLATALCGIIWFLILDIRNDLLQLHGTVAVNGNRITILESHTHWLETSLLEARSELKEHRERTEGHR